MPRPGRIAFLVLITVSLGLFTLPNPLLNFLQTHARAASTFTVNSTGDAPDSNTGDGVCDDGAGHCTLRAAIQQANATTGTDTINFSIGTGVQHITVVGEALPNVSDVVVIDATTQPGYAGTPLVEIGGSQIWGISITAGDSVVRGLAVGGFNEGIKLSFSGGNKVEGCYLGVFVEGGVRAAANTRGVSVTSKNNVIGGIGTGKGNLISGNSVGIWIAGSVSSGNVVIGNLIGTGPDGASALPNITGVELQQSTTGNFVGGTETGARNVISGNRDYGVFINGGASGNAVRGNFIGTDASGSAKLGNGLKGVLVQDAPSNVVGGADPAARNVISGNDVGVEINNQQSAGAVVQGNFIGTDAGGTAALANSVGVRLGVPGVTVGGTNAAARNVISGNAVGVQIFVGPVAVKGNFVGADVNGNSLPNSWDGIQLIDIAPSSTLVIGGDESGAGNTIAFNGGAGVAVKPTSFVTGEFPAGKFVTATVRRNSVHSNGGLGIDLIAPTAGNPREAANDGPTPNDAGDSDVGPNGLQNAPVFTSATSAGGNVNVKGTLNSAPNANYTLDFYANAACDLSGFGEGQSHLGSANVTTDANGNASFDSTFPASGVGQIVTATATDAAGDTSEFSLCFDGSGPGSVQFAQGSYSVEERGGSAVVTVTRTLGTSASATVNYSTSDGTAKAGSDYTAASGTITFAAGETTKTFGVPIIDDTTDEETETVNLTLSNAAGGALGERHTAVLSIVDDDLAPEISFGEPVVVAEGNAGTTDAVFTVNLSAPSAKTVSVVFFTLLGEGSANSQDFQSKLGTLTFAPGETTKTFAVTVNGDTEVELDETFGVLLSSPSNGRFPSDQNTLSTTAVIWDDDSPGIHFSAPRYAVNETDGSIAIGVVRRGDTSAPASVSYTAFGNDFTSQGVASQRADFTPASGKILFAPGETAKSFTVLVNDDAFVESPETVFLRLSDISDAPNTIYNESLIVNSDDTTPPTSANNPADSSQFFVRQHYHDFLNRDPDSAGLAFWVNEIEKCGADQQCREVRRINVSAAFFLSIEFQETGYLVYRTYKAAFGDATSPNVPGTVPVIRLGEFLPDTQQIGSGLQVGVGDWQAKLEANKAAYFQEFVSRPRFVNGAPAATTPAQLVDALFQNAGVTPTAAERQAAIDEFGGAPNTADTAARARALRRVAEHPALNQLEKNRAFVLMEYFGYMRRNPNDPQDVDFRGWKFWLDKLEEFHGNFVAAEMVKAFITSDEYRHRFGQ